MLSAFERVLARRPLLVKSGTGLVLGAAGDFTAQRLEGGAYDRRRGFAFTSLATFWNGACMHHLFQWLERALPQSHGLRSLLPKMCCTQLVINPFVYLPLFYLWTGAVLGRSLAQTREKAEKEYWRTLKATWALFVPFNLVNFGVVPARHQAAALALFSFMYNTAISLIANAESTRGVSWRPDHLYSEEISPQLHASTTGEASKLMAVDLSS
ncbi:hypothetical protein AB1Y20_019009 [Prymnesium parvum]|uniref:Peroxisomal membrane protein 2 n=1 Tax=Prymnesium parvum TaxID=97485 RepID=A0AB34JPT0_PRYPA